jgi:hypothetical protein
VSDAEIGPVAAGGMLIEWFDIVGDDDESSIVASIENDRPDYSRRPGLVRKLLPVVFSPASERTMSGGFYLFDTVANAREHQHWTEAVHRVDGRLFHERPFVRNLRGQVAAVVGVHDFAPLATAQAAQRVRIWDVPGRDVETLARECWPAVLSQGAAGLSSVWLGVNVEQHRIVLVTVAPRTAGTADPDLEVLQSLRGRLAIPFSAGALAAPPAIDLCMWIFTIWRPPGRDGVRAGVWPNSPPFPAPVDHVHAPAVGA